MRTILECVLPYGAAAICVAGLTGRTLSWIRTPAPFPLTIATPPRRWAARALDLLGEWAGFRALARGDRLLWLSAWLMHASLAVVVIGHIAGIGLLARQFVFLGASPEASARLSAVLGTAAGLVLAGALAVLLGRRLASPDLRRLSNRSDYFDLALLLAIAATGLLLRGLEAPIELADVRDYLGGLLTFHPRAMPREPLFVAHFTLVNVLLVRLPFSKMMHVSGALVGRLLLAQAPPRYPHPTDAGPDVPFLHRARRDAP